MLPCSGCSIPLGSTISRTSSWSPNQVFYRAWACGMRKMSVMPATAADGDDDDDDDDDDDEHVSINMYITL